MDRLTGRQREVLALVAEGMTDKEISTTLGISPATVEKHVGEIFFRLEVGNRVQAAVFYIRHQPDAVRKEAGLGFILIPV